MAESCGHNFCQKCLVRLINGRTEWNCPECRSDQTKQPGQLIRTRFIERAVESFNVAQTQNRVNNLCSHHNLELSLCKFYFKRYSIRFSVAITVAGKNLFINKA